MVVGAQTMRGSGGEDRDLGSPRPAPGEAGRGRRPPAATKTASVCTCTGLPERRWGPLPAQRPAACHAPRGLPLVQMGCVPAGRLSLGLRQGRGRSGGWVAVRHPLPQEYSLAQGRVCAQVARG